MKDEISLLEAQLTYTKRLEAMLAELRSQQAVLKEKVFRLEKKMQTGDFLFCRARKASGLRRRL